MRFLFLAVLMVVQGCDQAPIEPVPVQDLPFCRSTVSTHAPFISAIILPDVSSYRIDDYDSEEGSLVYGLRDAVRRRGESRRIRFLVRTARKARAERFLKLVACITDDLKTDSSVCVECLQAGAEPRSDDEDLQSSIFIWPRTYHEVPVEFGDSDLCVLRITEKGVFFNEEFIDISETKDRLGTLIESAHLLDAQALCIIEVDDSVDVQLLISIFALPYHSGSDLVLVYSG